jgi:phosphatidate phosphatase APP1
MSGWQGWASRLYEDLAAASRTAKDMALRRVPGENPHALLMYRGLGDRSGIWVYGRAVEDPGIGVLADEQSRWRNVAASLGRINASPLPHARVRLTVGPESREVVADDEGFIEAWIATTDQPRPGGEWVVVDGELLAPLARGMRVRAMSEALSPGHTPEMIVISDVDDTVLQSSVTNLMAAARVMLMENARTRLPFPGVTAFYQALRAGASGAARNPVVYVSSSPWNLYDLVTEFMDVQQIPRGPVLLRDVDLGLNVLSSKHHHDHKREAVRRVLQMFGNVPAILIGDSGQQDPEIYKDVVHEFPGRIRAVYIRDVSKHPERSAGVQALAEEILAAGSSLVLADDTLAAAEHAAAHGWIRPEAVDRVRYDKRVDEGTLPGKADIGTGGSGEEGGEPIVVE